MLTLNPLYHNISLHDGWGGSKPSPCLCQCCNKTCIAYQEMCSVFTILMLVCFSFHFFSLRVNHSGPKGWVWGIWRWWDQKEEHQWGCGPKSATWFRYTNAPTHIQDWHWTLVLFQINYFWCQYHQMVASQSYLHWLNCQLKENWYSRGTIHLYLFNFPLKSKKSLLLIWTP